MPRISDHVWQIGFYFACARNWTIYVVHLYFSRIDVLIRSVVLRYQPSERSQCRELAERSFENQLFWSHEMSGKSRFFDVPGIAARASELSPGHPKSVSEWSWWSAEDFIGLRFSVENVAEMMIFRPAIVGVMFCMDAFLAPIHLCRRRGKLYESSRRKQG